MQVRQALPHGLQCGAPPTRKIDSASKASTTGDAYHLCDPAFAFTSKTPLSMETDVASRYQPTRLARPSRASVVERALVAAPLFVFARSAAGSIPSAADFAASVGVGSVRRFPPSGERDREWSRAWRMTRTLYDCAEYVRR